MTDAPPIAVLAGVFFVALTPVQLEAQDDLVEEAAGGDRTRDGEQPEQLSVLKGGDASSVQDSSEKDLKYAAGFQSSFPAYGLSFMAHLNEKTSLQGVIGPFGSLRTFAGRGLYRFNNYDYHAVYGYGMVGGWNYSVATVGETAFGAGAGVGLEGDIRGLETEEELPPVLVSVEIGLALVNFDQVAYNFSTITAGFGIHYQF